MKSMGKKILALVLASCLGPDFDKGNYYADLASKTSDETQNDVPAWKGWFSLIVLLLCIVGFVLTGTKAFTLVVLCHYCR